MTQEQIKQLKEEIIDALLFAMGSDNNSVNMRLFEINLTMILESTFNTKEK